jgi:hypothetical protein
LSSSGQLKDATSEQIKHGGCLGLGLAAMGTHRADVYEQLKFCLYQVHFSAKLIFSSLPLYLKLCVRIAIDGFLNPSKTNL